MEEDKKSQWHPAFYGALHLELAENKQDLEYTEEFILNTLPLRVNSLTNQLREERAKELVYITGELKDLDDKYYADSVWEIVTRQNIELIKNMREDKEMCKAMAEILKPEIDAAFNSGFDNGFNDGFNDGIDDKGIKVFKNMIQRGFSREEAQSLAEISDELVERALMEE